MLRRRPLARAAVTTSVVAGTAARAQAETQVDIATFIQWVNATASDVDKLATFYTDRFRLPRVRRHGRLVATFPVSVSV